MDTPHTPRSDSEEEAIPRAVHTPEPDNHQEEVEEEEEEEGSPFEIYTDKDEGHGSPSQRRLSQCSIASDKENAIPPIAQSPARNPTALSSEPKTPGFTDLRLLNESGPVLEDPDSPTPHTKRTHSQSIAHSSPPMGHETEEEEEADTDYEDVTPRKKIREVREKMTPSPSRTPSRRRRPPHSPSPL